MIFSDDCNKCTFSGKYTDFKCKKKIEFQGLTAVINIQYKHRLSDDDCILFNPDCEDCKFKVINKNAESKYIKAKKEFCEINKPELMCDALFDGSIKCIENICSLVID